MNKYLDINVVLLCNDIKVEIVKNNYFSFVKLEVIYVVWILFKGVGSGLIYFNLFFLIWFMYFLWVIYLFNNDFLFYK